MSDQKQYVLYHANCVDGFAAAYVAWTVWGDDAEYIPVKYGDFPPEMKEGSRILILDFSYPRFILDTMASFNTLEILDHHKTAEANLADLEYATFDMNRSGAVMAWNWFYPYKEVPKLLLYVQDRDLWKWELPDSQAINAAIASFPKDLPTWEYLMASDSMGGFRIEGEAILRAQRQVIEQQCSSARLEQMAGYEVPMVNATAHVSEVGHELLKLYPNCPFSVSYRQSADSFFEWSLRSRGDFDVSIIAKRFGGGGHASAAGFRERN